MCGSKALAEFHCYRAFYSLFERANDLPRQLWLFHERRAFAVIDNFRRRTSHIDIEQRNFLPHHLFQHGGCMRNSIRLAPEELNGCFALCLANAQKIECPAVMKFQALGTHHFRIG